MKIKELHLRNIASIEKADIDFERDLTSSLTGEPATIFLISGDTGVGKSVLLDGISLALYKTTPRIAGVANPKENTYANLHGEQISISSLSQYTRLGISSGDECYSEVLFEGNDGEDYHAKLELGYTRNGTYRDPRWMVKKGNADWEKVDTRDSQILKAVGLTFQQFNRMAMLAQGQFAAFLCGDKKEREEILEQLTNTEIFSVYGEAVKNIFSRANGEKKIAEVSYQKEMEHILPPEKVEELQLLIAERSDKAATLQQEIVFVEGQIALVSSMVENERKAANAQARIETAKATQGGREYQGYKRLITDWTGTEKERQGLQQLRVAIQEKKDTESKLQKCQDRFGILSSDLRWQNEYIEQQTNKLDGIKQWLQEKADRDRLYQQVDETMAFLATYSSRGKQIEQLSVQYKANIDAFPQLREKLDAANRVFKEAEQAVKTKELEIGEEQNKINALNPQAIRHQLDNLSLRKQKSERWKEAYAQIEAAHKAIVADKEEVTRLNERIKELNESYLKAEEFSRQAKKLSDDALQRCALMSTSVEDSLKNLRAHLAELHAETCPLCGQPIVNLSVDKDFAQILLPLKEEQEKTARDYNRSVQALNNLGKERDTLAGQFNTKENGIEQQEKTLAEREKSLAQEAAQEGIQYGDSFAQGLDSFIRETERLIAQYNEKRQQVDKYQQQWQQRIEQKKPLDAALQIALKAQSDASHALKGNEEKRELLQKQLDIEKAELRKLDVDISSRLESFFPAWRQQLDETISALRKDAEEYKRHCSERDQLSQQLEKSRVRFEQMGVIRQKLLAAHATWNITYLAQQFHSANILSDWNELSSIVFAMDGKMQALDDTISQCRAMLEQWYGATHQTEEDLDRIIRQGSQLDEAQRFVKYTDEALHSASDALAEANQSISAAREKLGLQPQDTAPALESLQSYKSQLLTQKDQEYELIVTAKKQLETNEGNQLRLADTKQKMEAAQQRFVQWDKINRHFGGTRFRTLVQSYILRPLLLNANIYLSQITDRYELTCSEENDKLSILVFDHYNKNEVRSVTVLSGGERFMISLALSLALSSLNRPDLNVNILFIDEGFGTLDQKNLDSVMATLEKLQVIAGQSSRRVGIISHREELNDRIRTQIRVSRHGEGRSRVETVSE